MSKQINIRMDEMHIELIEKLIAAFEASEVKTNRTDIIQRSIVAFTKQILGDHIVNQAFEKYYGAGIKKED